MSRISKFFYESADPNHKEGRPVFSRRGDIVIATALGLGIAAAFIPKVWPTIEEGFYNSIGVTSIEGVEQDAETSQERRLTP
jgi:hypothetical protein